MEIESEGRTQEYVSDKLHEHGASVCGVTRSMLMVLMCNIKSLHVKEHTLSVALMLLKFY